MNRRQFLQGAALAASAPAAAKRPPNIVYIMGDDLGYSDLGCYGQKKIRTPNIDRLAAEGMRFTDAYSGCTVCAPSRSVLMTGLHMGHTTVRSNPGGVPILAEDFTVAQMLKQAGYATGGFGKWGLGDVGTPGVPWKHGFDRFFGYLHQVHAHFYYPKYLYDNEKKVALAGNENGKRTTYSHDAIMEQALGFIRASKGRPFFAYLPVTIPHWELLVPEDSFREYRGKFPEHRFEAGHYAVQENPHAAYAAMITRLDRDVGRVMSLLKEMGVDDNTLVIFTSDNGGAMRLRGDDFFESYGPFRGNKQTFYEGGIRVPYIARWPGRIQAGAVSAHPFAFYDFMATAAEVAGVRAPAKTDGISIAPTLFGAGRQRVHEFLYWELPPYDGKTGTFPKVDPPQAVRMGEWKAVRPKANAPLELYNLKTDIGETRNVAAEHPEVMAKIRAFLKTARTEPLPQRMPEQSWQ
ncbi:MAG: arylsulfatase [Bryobacteraceae bacterium]